MKKVYILRTKKNKFINENFLKAFKGFNERYFEIEFVYKNQISSIVFDENNILIAWIPVLQKIFKAYNIKPLNLEIPLNCYPFLKRAYKVITMKEVYKEISYNPPFFIKPYDKHKLFNGVKVNSLVDLIPLKNIKSNEKIIYSEVVNIISEYRFFILNNEIIGCSYYKGDSLKFPNIEFVKEILRNIQHYPIAFSIDIWIKEDGKNILIETNDSFALGAYNLDYFSYSKIIEERWYDLFINKK